MACIRCFISRDGTDWGVAWEGGAGASLSGSNGQLPIGTGSGVTWATLTAGNGLAVTNGAGSITVGETPLAGSAAEFRLPDKVPYRNGVDSTDNMADSADGCKFLRFTVPHSRTTTKVSFRVGTAGVTGAVGIYNGATLAKIRSVDSISLAAGAANNTQTYTSLTWDSGAEYIVVWSASSTTPTLLSTAALTAGQNSFWNVGSVQFGTCTALSSSGVMPATLTGMTAITGSDAVPFFTFHN
ncbi:MAG TPA: hypothetical protein VN256_06145 [Pyrinomonadaceae bacterium]|nr:hypothetical protein [Pyrinomonadaceae bacterium]